MFKLLGILIKASLFAVLILVLGHRLHWGDKTISDQVKTQMSHAEKSPFANKVRDWAGRLSQDVQEGNRRWIKKASGDSDGVSNPRAGERSSPSAELIPPSERQKLKALIRELNSSSRN